MSFAQLRSFRTVLRAGLLVGCMALGATLAAPPSWAAGVPVGAATPEQKKEASATYKKAAMAMKAGKQEEALQGFRASHDIVASPNSQFMIVRVLQAMGRNVDAYNEALAVIAASEEAAKVEAKYEKTASAARAKLAELKETIGLVTVNVTAPPGATLTVNGQPVAAEQWGTELPVEPGPLTVVLTAAEGGEETRSLSIVAGGMLTVDIAPPVAAPPTTGPEGPTPSPDGDGDGAGPDLALYGYIAGGVGAAGMVMFAIFGGLTLGEYSSLEDQCPDNSCTPEQSGDADTGKTFQTVANVSAVVGAVGLAAGAGLIIASLMDEEGAAGEEMAAIPTISIGPGTVVVSGSF